MTIAVYPLQTPAQFEAVCKAAEADGNHNAINPTHFVVKGQEVVGAVSIGTTVWWWLHSSLTPHDSRSMMVAVDTLLRDRGIRRYVALIPHSSPYNRVAEAVGYRKVEDTQVFVREL